MTKNTQVKNTSSRRVYELERQRVFFFASGFILGSITALVCLLALHM